MSASPTQLSLKLLRYRGYVVAVVEHWNPYAKIRQDAFGIADLIAIGHGHVILVQTTTGDHVAEHIKKIHASPNLHGVLDGAQVHVHGWRKLKTGKWECREIPIYEIAEVSA